MSGRCSAVVGNGSKSRRTKNGLHHLTTDKGWRRPFDDPISVPRGRELVTLKDAGTYITKLPKARVRSAGMASGDAGLDPGRDVKWADNACADRHHAGIEPSCRTGVRTVWEKASLGKAQA